MLEKMKPIIAEQLNVNEAEIKPETKFKDDLGADSLDLFEMVMALEEEFGIEIPSEDLEKIEKEILTTLPEDAKFTEEEQQQILLAIRGHRRKHEGMEPIEELFYDSDKRSRMCHSCPAQKQCNWTEEEKNMEIEI